MTSKSSSNGLGSPRAPSEKAAFILFIERKLNLQPDCLVIDLDIILNLQTFPRAEYAFWLDWHSVVDRFGEPFDAEEGLKVAQDGLWLASCRYDNLFFAADGRQPPLDQYCRGGGKSPALKMFFKDSTCYTSIIPIDMYKSRVVYWGSQPALKWTDEECRTNDIRLSRLSNIMI